MPRLTLGAKIYSIAVGIVALMCVAALLSFRYSRLISAEIHVVTQDHIPAYAALARANIRSLEQALQLRRAIIAMLNDHPHDQIEAELAAATAMSEQTAAELAAGEQSLFAAIEHVQSTHTAATSRLAERAGLLRVAHTELGWRVARVVATLRARDRTALEVELQQLDHDRDRLDDQLEELRAGMRDLLLSSAREARAAQQASAIVALVLLGLAGSLGLLGAGILTRRLAGAVRELVQAAEAVQAGRLDVSLTVRSRDEVGRLATAFNAMVEGLRGRERLRALFGKYVDPRIVADLLERPEGMTGEGRRQTMTVLFCDLRNSSRLGELTTPATLVRFLNHYLTAMSRPVHDEGGVIDKYIGDALMAYWGTPFIPEAEQAKRACAAALGMTAAFAAVQRELPELLGIKKNLPSIGLRIGIATGDVIAGNIGSENFRSYTVLGETVNLASRLEGANKEYGTTILLSARTAAEAATAGLAVREVDTARLAGMDDAATFYELLDHESAGPEGRQRSLGAYAEALAAYRRGDWAAARAGFDTVLAASPDDGPARCLRARLTALEGAPPATWDGIWSVAAK